MSRGRTYHRKNIPFAKVSGDSETKINKWTISGSRLKAFSIEDEFSFGKYKGHLVKDILKTDPDYIDYCEQARIFAIIDRGAL